MGMDMDSSSRLTGIVPILFSAGLFWLIVHLLLSHIIANWTDQKGQRKDDLSKQVVLLLVRLTGVEPVRPSGHKHLKLASLPIPAQPQTNDS